MPSGELSAIDQPPLSCVLVECGYISEDSIEQPIEMKSSVEQAGVVEIALDTTNGKAPADDVDNSAWLLLKRGLLEASSNLSIWAMFCGITIGSWSGLRNLLFGDGSYLRPIGSMWETLGEPVVACSMLVSAGSLVQASLLAESKADSDNTEKEATVTMPSKASASLFVCTRLLLLPAVGVLLLKLANDWCPWLLPSSFILKLVIVLQMASPSANFNLVALQVLGLSSDAAQLAKIYVPMYLFAVLSVTIWTVVGIAMFGS